jgi:hypothetical protein
MTEEVRYIIHAGHVRSKNDADIHYIPHSMLCRLYGLNPNSRNVIFWREGPYREMPGDIHLHPRTDGNYDLSDYEPLSYEKKRKRRVVDSKTSPDFIDARVEELARIYAPDYPDIEDADTASRLAAIEATLHGINSANQDLHQLISMMARRLGWSAEEAYKHYDLNRPQELNNNKS